jgi:hypothetical protein
VRKATRRKGDDHYDRRLKSDSSEREFRAAAPDTASLEATRIVAIFFHPVILVVGHMTVQRKPAAHVRIAEVDEEADARRPDAPVSS